MVCTHFHEEHIGNAAAVAASHGTAVHGAPETLAALRDPPALPVGRALLMGQAEPAGVERSPLGTELRTPRTTLRVIATPGHCRGNVALFEAPHGILFAGDAFLDELFTSPNADSDSTAWIATLGILAALPVRTLVSAHGAIISSDPAFAPVPGVVAEGEARGLSYSVIEACLFPWQRSWSWRTWFHDEGFRPLTCGEFSRTHLSRSLSHTPAAVPVRFPAFLRVAAQLAGAAPWIIANGHWAALAVLLAAWTMWWSVVGGAITRRMGLALAGAVVREPALVPASRDAGAQRARQPVPAGGRGRCALAPAADRDAADVAGRRRALRRPVP